MALDKNAARTRRVLTEEQSAFYHENGWLLAHPVTPNRWLERVRQQPGHVSLEAARPQ